MASEYNKIELTEEQMESINDPLASESELEITESQDNADDTSAKEPTVEESSTPEVNDTDGGDKLPVIEIDGISYDANTISRWRDDAANKHSWQKSNTQKAQQLSKFGKLAEKINGDETFRSHISEFFFDKPDEVKKLGLDGNIDIVDLEPEQTVSNTEIPQHVEQRISMLERVEGDRIKEARVDRLSDQLSGLESKYPEYLGGEKVIEFLDFADTNAAKFADGAMPNLERAYQVWSHGQMQEQLAHFKKMEANGNRNTGIIDTSQSGSKEGNSSTRPRKWKDINMNNPDIAKYFDK